MRSDVAVKVFGDDMDTMNSTAGEIAEVLEKIPGGIAFGPRTPFNVTIGPARNFVGMRIPLAEAKAIAELLQCGAG